MLKFFGTDFGTDHRFCIFNHKYPDFNNCGDFLLLGYFRRSNDFQLPFFRGASKNSQLVEVRSLLEITKKNENHRNLNFATTDFEFNVVLQVLDNTVPQVAHSDKTGYTAPVTLRFWVLIVISINYSP